MKLVTIILISVISAGFILCHREHDEFRSVGIILGPDIRDCVCCGGWYIEIDTTEYEFDTLPENSPIDLEKETFPLRVKLDWQLSDRIACPYKRIDIQRIAKD
jgi:hypothetical protein